MEHLRVPAPRRDVNGGVGNAPEPGQQNLGRRGKHAANRPEAGPAPVAVLDDQEWRYCSSHHSVPFSFGDAGNVPGCPVSSSLSMHWAHG